MSNKGRPTLLREEANKNPSLKRTDLAVWRYLDELTKGSDTCIASIPRIANSTYVSARQVQICIGRLINSGIIKRIGYDFGNPDRKKRGTVFRVLRHITIQIDVR